MESEATFHIHRIRIMNLPVPVSKLPTLKEKARSDRASSMSPTRWRHSFLRLSRSVPRAIHCAFTEFSVQPHYEPGKNMLICSGIFSFLFFLI